MPPKHSLPEPNDDSPCVRQRISLEHEGLGTQVLSILKTKHIPDLDVSSLPDPGTFSIPNSYPKSIPDKPLPDMDSGPSPLSLPDAQTTSTPPPPPPPKPKAPRNTFLGSCANKHLHEALSDLYLQNVFDTSHKQIYRLNMVSGGFGVGVVLVEKADNLDGEWVVDDFLSTAAISVDDRGQENMQVDRNLDQDLVLPLYNATHVKTGLPVNYPLAQVDINNILYTGYKVLWHHSIIITREPGNNDAVSALPDYPNIHYHSHNPRRSPQIPPEIEKGKEKKHYVTTEIRFGVQVQNYRLAIRAVEGDAHHQPPPDP